ncbi:MAG: hypothetical protein QX191_06500 [Methylococcaceae bacterium]
MPIKKIETIEKNINEPEVESQPDFRNNAKLLFDAFIKKNGFQKGKALKELGIDNIKSVRNLSGQLANGKITIPNAIEIIRRIEEFNKNRQSEDNNLHIRKDISFDDISDFFLSQQVGKVFDKEKGEYIAGLYLLFRKSNVDESKIIVSYFKVEFKNNKLHFESKRNNINSEDSFIINVKTNGIIINNTDESFFCLGISQDIKDHHTKPFIESITIYKNKRKSYKPNSGYWCGNIVQGSNSNPFVNKIVLVKIQDQSSKESIEKEINTLDENEILKLHEKTHLERTDNIVNEILSKEIKNCNQSYKVDGILKKLDMNLDALGFFKLERF